MSYTIGDMIDQLTIANIRLWHIEDDRRELQKLLETTDEENRVPILEKISQSALAVSKVNKERNTLIDQINQSLRVLSGEIPCLEINKDQLLGTGKNKNYKTEQS